MDINEEKYNRGIELLKSSHLKEALILFNELIKDFPKNADYWSERGVVHLHLNEKKKALIDMDQAVLLQPQKSYRYSSRAYVKAYFKSIHEAIKDYQKAIELDPEDSIAHNNLGLLEEQLGYQEKAKKRFKVADELNHELGGRTDQGIEGESINPRNIQKEIDAEKEEENIWKTLKTITSKEGVASFSRFLKSGFKKT